MGRSRVMTRTLTVLPVMPAMPTMMLPVLRVATTMLAILP